MLGYCYSDCRVVGLGDRTHGGDGGLKLDVRDTGGRSGSMDFILEGTGGCLSDLA